jgi:hypothetical protein
VDGDPQEVWTSCRVCSGIADATLAGVQGTITSRDVLLHSLTILRLWGPAFYVRCLKAIASGRTCTFLDVLARDR